jgi:two-component system chemotaxis response regulator CheB
MSGLAFLRKLMAEDPIPVVVCSGSTGAGTDAALNALGEGAVAIVTKAKLGVRNFLNESALLLVDTIRGAAEARVATRRPQPALRPVAATQPPPTARPASHRLVAIGASTGGTDALRAVLEPLPPDAPGLVIVQHMPEGFTGAFARRLDAACRIHVKEAQSGDPIVNGQALLAPGNRHLVVQRHGDRFFVELVDGDLVSRHRPSVDVLFRSVAHAAGASAVGVILTGMGGDGAAGLLEMKRSGASTLAQNEATSVVFGMPKEAIARGAVDEIVPLPRMASSILNRIGVGQTAGR